MIRIVGAFCILGAIALMLMPAWVVLGNVPAFAEMMPEMNVTSFIAVVLMIVPVILDIIFERKKEIKVVEE